MIRFSWHVGASVSGRLAFAAAPGVLCFIALCDSARAQAVSRADRAERLQQLVAAEQAALDSGDAPQILTAGKQLGALALRMLGGLYTTQGRCGMASDMYQQSMTADDLPDSSQARVQTSLLLLASDLCANRPEDANHTAEQIISTAGDTAEAHLLISNARHGGGDLAGTIAELHQAVTLAPQFGPAHLALGDAFWELNEYQYNLDTLREFTAAQSLSPKDFFTDLYLGFILSQYERYGEASTYLGYAAAVDTASPDPWLQLGLNSYAQNRPTEARTSLEKAVALTGTDEGRNGFQIRRAYAVLSRIAASEGREAEAEKFALQEAAVHGKMRLEDVSTPLSESTEIVPNHASRGGRPIHSDGLPSTSSPEQAEVEQHLKIIVAKSLNDGGTVLAREHDYAAALPLFRIAAGADPALRPVMRNLGLAAFHTGAFEEAATALARALEQVPNDNLVRNDLDQSRAMLAQHPGSPKP